MIMPEQPGDSESDNDPVAESYLRRVLNRLDIDRAVFYAITLRIWQLLAGAVSVVLISLFFTPEIQGYYYTFSGLLALQSFFELGLHIVIISSASHEWARLHLDSQGRVAGDPDARSRLISLGRWIVAWYAIVAFVFTVIVVIAGTLFFSAKPTVGVEWFPPWFLLVLLSALLLWALPLNALLEGCNQVATVNRFRLIQAVCANLVVWTAIALGWGLWAAVAMTAARLLCDLVLIGVQYRRFFADFWRKPEGAVIDWSTEVWPMQWRIAVGALFSYFEFSLYTPVLFFYHGPVLAGQMGLTWTLLIAVQSAALSWPQSRVPRFGMLISERKFAELDRLFIRLTAISLAALTGVSMLAWSCVWLMYATEFRLAERFLPPLPTGLFFVAIVLYQVPRCQEIYLRAHKREPTMVVNVMSCCLIGLAVWILGSRFGAIGAAGGYLAVVALFILPVKTYLWLYCRRQWHGET